MFCVQQILQPTSFRFIESSHILDVTCGANFIVVIIKKSGHARKKLVTKNNYVVIHKSENEAEGVSHDGPDLFPGL